MSRQTRDPEIQRVRTDLMHRLNMYDIDPQFARKASQKIGTQKIQTYLDIGLEKKTRREILTRLKDEWYDADDIRRAFRDRILEFLAPPLHGRRRASQGGGRPTTPPEQHVEPLFSDYQRSQKPRPVSSSESKKRPTPVQRALTIFSTVRSQQLLQRVREWFQNPPNRRPYPAIPIQKIMTDTNIRNMFRRQGGYTDLLPQSYTHTTLQDRRIIDRTLAILDTPPFDSYRGIDRFRLSLERRLGLTPFEWFQRHGSSIVSDENLGRDYIDWIVATRTAWTPELIASMGHMGNLFPLKTIHELCREHPIPPSRWDAVQRFLVHDKCDRLEYLILYPFQSLSLLDIAIDEIVEAFKQCENPERRLACQILVERRAAHPPANKYWKLWIEAMHRLEWNPQSPLDFLFADTVDLDRQFRPFLEKFTVPADTPFDFVHSTLYNDLPIPHRFLFDARTAPHFDPNRFSQECIPSHFIPVTPHPIPPNRIEKLRLLLTLGMPMRDEYWNHPRLFDMILPVIQDLYVIKIRRLKELVQTIDPEFLRQHPELLDLPVRTGRSYMGSPREYIPGESSTHLRYDHAHHVRTLETLENHVETLFHKAQQSRQAHQRSEMGRQDALQTDRERQRIRTQISHIRRLIEDSMKASSIRGDQEYHTRVRTARDIDQRVRGIYQQMIVRQGLPSIFEFEEKNRESLLRGLGRRQTLELTAFLQHSACPLIPLLMRNLESVITTRVSTGRTGLEVIEKYCKHVNQQYIRSLPDDRRRSARDLADFFGE